MFEQYIKDIAELIFETYPDEKVCYISDNCVSFLSDKKQSAYSYGSKFKVKINEVNKIDLLNNEETINIVEPTKPISFEKKIEMVERIEEKIVDNVKKMSTKNKINKRQINKKVK